MDLYLPADYLRLREGLDDWRDAPANREIESPPQREHPLERQADGVDPSWKTI